MSAEGAASASLVAETRTNPAPGRGGLKGWIDGLILGTRVDAYFKVTARGSTLSTELMAGAATFLTMCYILTVNAGLLSLSGGPCECSSENAAVPGCVWFDLEYKECQENMRRQLITATALSSFIGTALMGLGANLPFALAPGMGMNAYFTFDVVGVNGTGSTPWSTAMTAIAIEGVIFVLLAVTGLRVRLAKLIPASIKLATTGGIGLFLAHIGLQSAEGIGLVVTDIATGITLGGCPPDKRNPAFYCPLQTLTEAGGINVGGNVFTGGNPSGSVEQCLSESLNYTCDTYGGRMTSATTWIGICGVLIIGILMAKKVKSAIIIGVLSVTFLSWIPDTDVSYFEEEVMPGGESRWDYFTKVVNVESLSAIGGQLDFDGFGTSQLWIALFTFLYVDLLDTTGTLFAMAKFANMLDEEGNFEGQTAAFCVDGVATTVGAFMGTSPVTTYIESATGIELGGRTGLTALTVSFLFLLSIFFGPILASVPPWATGPALICVGAMMMKGVKEIDWNDYGEAIPAWICMILMPLTYSIAYGIIGGLMSYTVINGSVFLWDRLVNSFCPSCSSDEDYNGSGASIEMPVTPKPIEPVGVSV